MQRLAERLRRTGAHYEDECFLAIFCISTRISFCVPEQDAVVVITSGVKDMQGVLNLVWERLLPALKSAPLATDDEARKKLEHALKGLSLRPRKVRPRPQRRRTGNMCSRRTHRNSKRSRWRRATPSSRVSTGSIGGSLAGTANGRRAGWRSARSRRDRWRRAAAWIEDDTFAARICFYETPFIVELKLKFAGDELLFDAEANVGFGPTRQKQLVGKAE